jgi:sec-independent protein translocase protein TatB
MFEISWSELLILAVVTLIFVGPKDLPKFLSTMGRYAGMVRRQAAEFRAQFDEAMRQAELDALKKEVDDVRSDIQNSVNGVPAAKTPAPPQQGSRSEAMGLQPETPAAVELQPTMPLGRSADEIKSIAQSDSAGMDADKQSSGNQPDAEPASRDGDKPSDKTGA